MAMTDRADRGLLSHLIPVNQKHFYRNETKEHGSLAGLGTVQLMRRSSHYTLSYFLPHMWAPRRK